VASTAIPTSLHELQTKLVTLVFNVQDRLSDDESISRTYLLEILLDRLFELAAPNQRLCGRCQRRPITVLVYAGRIGTDDCYAETVCANCTLQAVTSASSAGAVHVDSYPNANRRQVVTP
jgi:hypothetical protein